MKKTIFYFLFTVLAVATIPAESFSQNNQSTQHYFQLKTYHFDNVEQQKRADQYFEAAYLPALHRSGIDQVGVFKPHNSDTSSSLRTYILIPFNSLKEFSSLNNTLTNDSQYLADGKPFLNATNDEQPYKRIQTILLKAFEDAPTIMSSDLNGSLTERVYELRSYESATEALNENKVAMFNAGGEVDIFDRLNFNAIFYGNVIAGDAMPNLMYMTSFKDMDSRDKHWDSFSQDSEWKELAAVEKYQGNVSHIDIYFLQATPYSDL